MNTRYLLFLLAVCALVPWVVTIVGGDEAVGMYARREHVQIQNDSDVYDSIWHVQWVRSAFIEGFDPRICDERSLAWHNMGWPDLFFSLVTGSNYNLMLFTGALFSALAGYFLARSWGLGKNGSMVAGIVILWMPVHLIRIYQHYSVASIGYVLLVFSFMRIWILKGNLRNLMLLGLFAALALMESLYHGITMALGWFITSFLMGKKYAKRFLLVGAVVCMGCILGFLWFITAPGVFEQNPGKDWKEAVFWAAEPQSFLLPSFMGNPLILGYMPNDFEGVVSPGVTVAVLGLFYCWKKRSWKAIAAVTAVVVFSMGPLLKINGLPTPIPLPYMALVKIPWLSAARAPARLAILVGIMAAIAAGALIESRKEKTAWLLTGLILLEIFPVRLRSIEATIPHFYHTEKASGVTLEIPSSDMIRRYSLFSAADNSPRIVRFLARGGEVQMERIPESLRCGSSVMPSQSDIIATGAETVVYNRWMFTDSTRYYYDALYEDIFTGGNQGDSVWVWVKI